jgi:hypothetical protein
VYLGRPFGHFYQNGPTYRNIQVGRLEYSGVEFKIWKTGPFSSLKPKDVVMLFFKLN